MQSSSAAFANVRDLGDVELIAGLRRLVRADHKVTARLLLHLGEVEARGLYREHAFESMFAYAVEELHMSEAEAYLRIQAARLGREFPLIVQMLANGELHLTAIKLLGPHLTQANHVQVLERARFKPKRDIEVLVAELAPKPDVPSVMRKLPMPAVPAMDLARAAELAGTAERAQEQLPVPRPMELARRDPEVAVNAPTTVVDAKPDQLACAPRETLAIEHSDRRLFQLKSTTPNTSSTTPLSPGRYRVAFTVGRAMHDTLEQLQNLLRHQVPNGDLGVILERAANLLLEKTMKERFAQTMKKKKAPSEPRAPAQPALSARVTHGHARRSQGSAPACGRSAEPNKLQGRESDPVQSPSRRDVRGIDDHQIRIETSLQSPRAVDRRASQRGNPNADTRVQPTKTNARYVPRAVVRAVHERDGQRCTFVSPEGRRCNARGLLELHHHAPHAKGGGATTENLRTVCRAHNALFAERDFGKPFMQSKLMQARQKRGEKHNQQVPERQQQ
jgi:hypothetical protein